jgi:uncharacterized protein YjbI with pentapeptide repeats
MCSGSLSACVTRERAPYPASTWRGAISARLTLRGPQLGGAELRFAHLERANLRAAHLEGATLDEAHLEGVTLYNAHLERADLRKAHLEGADLSQAHLEGARLAEAHLERAHLARTNLERAHLGEAHLAEAYLSDAHLEEAYLSQAHLERAILFRAHLERAYLSDAHLEGANLSVAHLEGANLGEAHLEGASLDRATLDASTRLDQIVLDDHTRLGYVRWGDAYLGGIDWSRVRQIGEDTATRTRVQSNGKRIQRSQRIEDFEYAITGYDFLIGTLQAKNILAPVPRFRYRAEILKRTLYRLRRQLAQFLVSWFLSLITGYGFKPGRIFVAYAVVILTFASTFYTLNLEEHDNLSPVGALVFSVTSFHGRGFFPGGLRLDDPITILAASEAFVGLIIEAYFATVQAKSG